MRSPADADIKQTTAKAWHRHAEHRAERIMLLHRPASDAATSPTSPPSGWYRVRQLQFSGIFVALGFVGNGVITVMINSP